MRDLMLRFDDEAACAALKVERDPGTLELDVIGPIGGEGWHVNLRCADDRDLSALAPFEVEPAEPLRVWL